MLKLVVTLWIIAFASAWPAKADEFNLPAPSRFDQGDRINLWSTRYYISTATAVPGGTGIKVLQRDGKPLGYDLSNQDFCFGALQGTIRVLLQNRSTIINADGLGQQSSAHCTYKNIDNDKLARQAFREVPQNAPFGLGTAGYRLIPYRTVAVDRRYVGTAFFIPALRGLRIATGSGTTPDGNSFVHDGYVFGADVGDAVKGTHTDFFTGFSHLPAPSFVTSQKSRPYTAYIVRDPVVREELEKLHLLSH